MALTPPPSQGQRTTTAVAMFGKAEVGTERTLAPGDIARVDVGHGFADVAVLGFLLQRRVLGHRQHSGIGREFAVAQATAAGGVDDFVVGGGDALKLDFPSLGRSLAQHQPGGGPGGAQAFVVLRDAPRTVGVLIPVLDIAVGLDDLDTCPVGVQFIGDDLGQRRSDALTHFRAVDRHADRAVTVHRKEQAWLEGRRRRRLPERAADG